MDRHNGQTVMAKPYMEVNWTKGIDQKTGKPIDYDPTKDIQVYAGVANQNPREPTKRVCPGHAGGNNYWPSTYSPRTKLLYHTDPDQLRGRIHRHRQTQQGRLDCGLAGGSDRSKALGAGITARGAADLAVVVPPVSQRASSARPLRSGQGDPASPVARVESWPIPTTPRQVAACDCISHCAIHSVAICDIAA
jgi:hypothetical protein